MPAEIEILLYEQIDAGLGTGAKAVRQQLAAAGSDVAKIHLRINSPGGQIAEGLALHNTLRAHPARVIGYVDGVAASMASVVLMAADEIVIAQNGFIMVHNPMNAVEGEAEDLRDVAELLDSIKKRIVEIYATRTRLDAAEVAAMMDAETWMDSEEAVAKGFADRVAEPLKLAATFDLSRYEKVPKQLVNRGGTVPMSETTNQNQPATIDQLRAACQGADPEFLLGQLDARATIEQARDAWFTRREKQLREREEALEAKAKKPGNDPLGGHGGGKGGRAGTGEARVEWDRLVAEKKQAGVAAARAVSLVNRENPGLRARMIREVNEAAGRPVVDDFE